MTRDQSERFDTAVRAVALYVTGDDPHCTATQVAEWPYAAKRTILELARGGHDVEDLVAAAPHAPDRS